MYANSEKEKDEWIGAIGRYFVSVVIHPVAQSFTVPFGIRIPTSALIAV